MKAEVLAAIGETGLSRSGAVNAALAANDRVKYLLTLLQMAAAHADQPDQPPANLKRERIACGIDEPSLDAFTAAARRQGAATTCRAPPSCWRASRRISPRWRRRCSTPGSPPSPPAWMPRWPPSRPQPATCWTPPRSPP